MDFEQSRESFFHFYIGNILVTPTPLQGGQETVVELSGYVPVDADVQCFYTGALESQVAVAVVAGREQERIAYRVAAVYPAVVDGMPIVPVAGTYLYRYLLCLVIQAMG